MRDLAGIPNLLTLARLALAPVIFWAIATGRCTPALWWFAAAALTDGLDGMFARRFHQITRAGAYLDPIADKILLSGVYVSLAIVRSVPYWLVVIILGRDIFLLAASGTALLFTNLRQFPPSLWGKASTFVQIACAIAWMAQNALDYAPLGSLARALIWPTAAATIWSGLDYTRRGWHAVLTHGRRNEPYS